MRIFKQKDKSYLFIIITIALVVIATFLFFEYKITKGQFGAPLDDVYIHFQFSKNLAEGKGLSFNANVPTPGSTAPAWTILITFFYIILNNHLIIAKGLSVLFFVMTGITTYYLANEVLKSKKWALIAAIFTILSGRLAWSALSGMEVTLFTFLLMLAILLYAKKKSFILVSAILGLASTVRPEGYVIFVFFVIAFLFPSIKSYRSSRSIRSFSPLIASCLIYALIITPYLIFSFATTGYILPNTFRAQSTIDAGLIFKLKLAGLYLLRYGYLIVTDNPIVAMGIPFGIYSVFKNVKCQWFTLSEHELLRMRVEVSNVEKFKQWILIAVGLGFPLTASIIAPNLRHHGRYTMPLIPLYTVLGIIGIRHLIKLFNKKFWQMHIATKITASLLAISYMLLTLCTWANTFGWNTKNINDLHVHIGNWVKDNTPENSVIALNDIGAITYISQREIIDMVGLVSPEVLEATKGLPKEEHQELLWNYLQEQKPDYIIIFPSWYPEIAQKPELEEVYRVKLDRYSIVDGEMAVFKYHAGAGL